MRVVRIAANVNCLLHAIRVFDTSIRQQCLAFRKHQDTRWVEVTERCDYVRFRDFQWAVVGWLLTPCHAYEARTEN